MTPSEQSSIRSRSNVYPTLEGAADWRVTMTDPRIAHVEVTMTRLRKLGAFGARVHTKPGSEWADQRLSRIWTVMVRDRRWT